MADFGTPVASIVNVDPNKGLTTLSNLMSLDQQKQAIRSKEIGIQQQQATLGGTQADTQAKTQAMEERGRVTQMLATGKDDKGNDIRDANGEPDISKILPAIGRIAPFTGQEFAQNIIKTHSDKVGLQSSVTGLDQKQRGMYMAPMQAIALDPSDENIQNARATLDGIAKAHPESAATAKYTSSFLDQIAKAPKDKRTHLANSLSAMLQGGQQVQTQPGAASVDTGPTLQTGTVAPPVAGGGFTSTTETKKDISPQIIIDAQGQPHFIGTPGSGKGGGGASAFPTRTGVESLSGATADMGKHFSGLNDAAAALPITTALTKTIEGLAPSAYTGVGGDKKQYVTGVLQAFHITPTGDAQTDTNLMNKAMAQLNISSKAGTDAARALVEAGQPNSKMDAPAIREAAGTIAAQVRMNEAERNFLHTARYSNRGAGDIEAYQEGRQKFEANADPRIWQYEELAKTNPEQARSFLSRQPDRHELVKKTKALSALGFFQ